jgi:hypothetical protein
MKATRSLVLCLACTGICAGLGVAGASAVAASGPSDLSDAWTVVPGMATPASAAVAPSSTNLNIDRVVLACQDGSHGRLLQLQLYQTEEGYLGPADGYAAPPAGEPRADIAIDGQRFPVSLVLAENHAVLGDTWDGPLPKLSDRLVKAVETGNVMTLRAGLPADPDGSGTFEGEAVVNLGSPGKSAAVEAMRQCTEDRRSASR